MTRLQLELQKSQDETKEFESLKLSDEMFRQKTTQEVTDLETQLAELNRALSERESTLVRNPYDNPDKPNNPTFINNNPDNISHEYLYSFL